MIQIYSAGNTSFSTNGNAVLHPTAATARAQINGTWQATLEHPVDESGVWEFITEQAVIKMPFYNGDQLFRIYQVTKTDYKVIAYAYPIFYDSANDCFLTDVRPTNKTGQQALDIMCAVNSKYTGFSNVTKTATAYFEYKNLMEAINGTDGNSFLNRWGGEIEFDNFHIIINEQIGSDNGLEFRYGKNLNGISQQVDTSQVVTRIYPKAYNGRKLTTGNGYVDSPYISKYPTIKTKVIQFSELVLAEDATEDMYENPAYTIFADQAALNAAIIAACQEQFSEGEIDVPKVTITISNVVDLTQVEGYEGLAQPMHLGDTVHLYHEILGIEQSARIIALTYDAIRECVSTLTIGTPEINYFNQLSSAMQKVNLAINEDGSLKGENLTGLVDLKKANLYQMFDAADLSDKPAILFENNDETSALYGAMAIGTQGFMIADTKNSAGEWIWSTWGTAKGLVADYIRTGTLSATLIAANSIGVSKLTGSIANGNWIIDLDNGTLTIGNIMANNIQGGTLTLGGADNGNGVMRILDASGNVIGTWDKDGISILQGTVGNVANKSYIDIDNGNIYSYNSYTSVMMQMTGATLAFRDETNSSARIAVLSGGRGTIDSETIYLFFLRTLTPDSTPGATLMLYSNGYVRLQSDNDHYFGINRDGSMYMLCSGGSNGSASITLDPNDYSITVRATGSLNIRTDSITYNGLNLGKAPTLKLTTPSFSSLPVTFYSNYINGNHILPSGGGMKLSNPSAQTGDWTITTADGSITISGSISGSTTAEFTLIAPCATATALTTSS